MPHLDWSSIVWKVVSVYLSCFGLFIVYFFAQTWVKVTRKSKRTAASISEKIWTYTSVTAVILFFAIMVGFNLGTHKEGGDDFLDAGETVVDYVPSDKARWTTAVKTFLIILPAAAAGLYSGFSKDKTLSVDERLKIERQIDRNAGSDS